MNPAYSVIERERYAQTHMGRHALEDEGCSGRKGRGDGSRPQLWRGRVQASRERHAEGDVDDGGNQRRSRRSRATSEGIRFTARDTKSSGVLLRGVVKPGRSVP